MELIDKRICCLSIGSSVFLAFIIHDKSEVDIFEVDISLSCGMKNISSKENFVIRLEKVGLIQKWTAKKLSLVVKKLNKIFILEI